MTLALRYAVRSDVGLLREGNEDSAYAGPHLLAVADGMGGHAAGEVASAATITTIAPLDAEQAGNDLAAVLEDAVARANLRLQELIISDPAIEGMGTTLTALLWSDGYAALCHIGDSRAYRLRSGHFTQITHDHTLVQSLVDEGKITEDDVATHPHRSLLLRALDGRTIAEPDVALLETYPGDRYLLCSDGLSGVVTEQTLAHTLSSVRDPDKAALQLVELAIRGGGPDNITCIVADVMETAASAIPPTWTPVFAGAAALGDTADLRTPPRPSSPATRARHLARTSPQPAVPSEPTTGVWPAADKGYRDGYTGSFDTTAFRGANFQDAAPQDGGYPGPGTGPGSGQGHDTASFDRPDFSGPEGDLTPADVRGRGRRHTGRHHRYDPDDGYGARGGRRRFPIVWTALILLVVLLVGGGYAGWRYNQDQFYVGVSSNGHVAIFRGSNQTLAGIKLYSQASMTPLLVDQLRARDQAALAQTIPQSSDKSAEQLIDSLQTQVTQCEVKWNAFAKWPAAHAKYETEVAVATAADKATKGKTKIKVNPNDNPGPQPDAPDAADCAAEKAFGIKTSSSAPPVTSTVPPVTSTAKASTAPTGKAAHATASATPNAAAP
jgi:PPM family protein phosphatase